jgi:Na+-driven multidrug efflux pump
VSYSVAGSTYGAILRLAMPTVVAMLTQSAVNEIDVVFFSRLPCPVSSNGQAALLPSLIVLWAFGGSLSAVSVGTQALTARRYAEGNYKAAGAVLFNAAAFSIIAGIVATLIGLFAAPALFSAIIKVPEVREIAVDYTRFRLFGVVSMAMTMAIKAFFDGIGRTHVHLVAAIVMNAFNVLFCWLFIFGNAGAPAMGPAGAGLAGLLATWIGLVIMTVFAGGVRKTFHPLERGNRSGKITWEILRLSIPAALATVTMMVGFGLFSSIVGLLDARDLGQGAGHVEGLCGVEAVNSAATTNVVMVLKLTFTACIAFGTATATLVGQSLGARRPDDAARFGWASVRLGLAIFGVVGLLEGVLFTPQIASFISGSDAVRDAMLLPMRLMGVATPIIAVAMILSEALFGAGNTRFVAIAQFLLVFGCLVPLAYVLAVPAGFGLLGIWMAACVYALLAAITMALKFRAGDWKKIEL